MRMDKKIKKQYLHLDSIPILSRTLMAFDKCDPVREIILVVPKEDGPYCKTDIIDPYGLKKKICLVEGGKDRFYSVLKGLNRIRKHRKRDKGTIVMIHDGVRPFVSQRIIKESIMTAGEWGACVPAIKITDTIKEVSSDSLIKKTTDRSSLYRAQTPQTFKLDLILRAYDHAIKRNLSGTDDAVLVEHLGLKVKIIKGSKKNIKLTTPEDLVMAKYLLTLNLN